MVYMQWLMAERKRMTEFGRTLWRLMQDHPDGEINRTELAERLTNVGFKAEPANVSGWLNGDRMPPPGFVYYSALALDLNDEQRCEVTWSYLKQYRDNVKGRSKNVDIEAIEQERSGARGKNGAARSGRDRH
jgi:hypothetical protein